VALQPGDAVGVVGAVANLARAPLEPTGKDDIDVRAERMANERLGRLAGAAELDASTWTSDARASSGRITTVSSVWTTASFSVAICSTVSPRTSVCSSPTLVSRTTRERRTFVASWRPPSPASTTATSTPASAKAVSAAAVIDSNWVARTLSAAARTRRNAAGKSAQRPPIRIRSSHARTWGESVAPTPRPSPSSSCSIVTVAVDFPFVPTTWIAG